MVGFSAISPNVPTLCLVADDSRPKPNKYRLIYKLKNIMDKETQIPTLSKTAVSRSYIITDEIPKEGDYAVNPINKKNKPRLVERASETNDTLGFNQPESWFTWQPLRDYHRKVVFE